jgi:uncharacterized protein (TIGR03435 family)
MIAAVSNHLWQSTLFVLAAWFVTLALRKNGAHVRHAVWVLASVKFLVPFALLMRLGSALPSVAPAPTAMTSPDATPGISVAVDRIAQPFSDADGFMAATAPAGTPVATNRARRVLAGIWACGFSLIAFLRLRDWRRIRAAVRSGVPLDLPGPVPVRASPSLLEPGVVGVWRPVLLVPAGIERHLTPAQLQAVLEHERCHVRRRDNLASAMHMVVEAAFWFHPLVWWVGARLVDERERACDEHVLRVCGEPQTYAESILNVCKFYVASPVACVSGVSGADLRARVAAILANRIGLQLDVMRKAALVTAGLLAIAAPLVAGALVAPLRARDAQDATTEAARFDLASIKPCPAITPTTGGQPARPGGRNAVAPWAAQVSPGRAYWHCATLAQLIDQAYTNSGSPLLNATTHVRIEDDFQPRHVRGGPDWVRTDTFTIEARAPLDVTTPALAGSENRVLVGLPAPMSRALRATLEDRFELRVHRATEAREMFALSLSRAGLNKARMMTPAPGDCQTIEQYFLAAEQTAPQRFVNPKICGRAYSHRDGTMEYSSFTLQQLATDLSRVLDLFVLDRTGIDARFNFALKPVRDENTALDVAYIRELSALGLTLARTHGPAEYLVIDSVQKLRPDLPASAQEPGRRP